MGLDLRCETLRVGTSLVVQWLRLYNPNVGAWDLIPGPYNPNVGAWDLIPGHGTGSHIPQLNSHAATKDPNVSMQTEDPMCCKEDPAQPNK